MLKKYKAGLSLNIAIIAFGLVCTIVSLIRVIFAQNSNIGQYITLGFDIVLYAHIIYYTIRGYKTPHGNLLRNFMLLYALSIAISSKGTVLTTSEGARLCISICIGAICFMAGRLNKYNQNRIISVVVLLMLVYICHSQIGALAADGQQMPIMIRMINYNKVVFWIAITSSYFTRYLAHKLAGLE